MKFRSSSSGWESRPGRGEPARAGSEPCDSLGNGIVEASVRERVGRGYVASKTMSFPDAERSVFREGDAGLSVDLLEEK